MRDYEGNFRLYLVLTHPVAGYESCAKTAVDCGVRYRQLRMKNMPQPTVLETARAIRAINHLQEIWKKLHF